MVCVFEKIGISFCGVLNVVKIGNEYSLQHWKNKRKLNLISFALIHRSAYKSADNQEVDLDLFFLIMFFNNVFHVFLEIYDELRYTRLYILRSTIYMRMLNVSDHELRIKKSA